MRVPSSILRQYDIRGTVGDQLTPDLAHAVGQALATLAAQRLGRAPRIAVGRDNRPSGPGLAEGVIGGIVAAGGTVVDVGACPTPALYFATHTLQVDGGLQVTGSHNPPEFNGFKMVVSHAAIYGDDIQEMYQMISADRLDQLSGGSRVTDTTVLAAYRAAIVKHNTPLARKVKVVADCGNGVTSLVAIQTLRDLGCDVVALFDTSDGRFPNHHPDPTVV